MIRIKYEYKNCGTNRKMIGDFNFIFHLVVLSAATVPSFFVCAELRGLSALKHSCKAELIR